MSFRVAHPTYPDWSDSPGSTKSMRALASPMKDKEALEAEVQRLKEEVERRQLEAKIKQLEAELQAKQASEASEQNIQTTLAAETTEEEEYYEEYVEETENGEIEYVVDEEYDGVEYEEDEVEYIEVEESVHDDDADAAQFSSMEVLPALDELSRPALPRDPAPPTAPSDASRSITWPPGPREKKPVTTAPPVNNNTPATTTTTTPTETKQTNSTGSRFARRQKPEGGWLGLGGKKKTEAAAAANGGGAGAGGTTAAGNGEAGSSSNPAASDGAVDATNDPNATGASGAGAAAGNAPKKLGNFGGKPAYSQLPATPPTFTARKIPNVPASPAGEETPLEQLLGPKLITNSKMQKSSTVACMQDQELVALYFGAKWRPECKRFHPVLSDFYYTASQKHRMEIVYIPADRTLIEFKDSYGKMPFLAMPSGTQGLKNTLTKKLCIVDMPSLVILNVSTGHVVTTMGRDDLEDCQRNNAEQADELIARWKAMTPIPIEGLEASLQQRVRLNAPNKGTLYWQE